MSRGPASILVDAAGNQVGVLLDGAVYRLQTTNGIDEDRTGLVRSAFKKDSVVDGEVALIVDVSSSSYKHSPGTKLVLAAIRGDAIKSNSNAEWDVEVGVVLTIDGTQATVGWLVGGTIPVRGTAEFSGFDIQIFFPLLNDLEVSAGDFLFLQTNYKESAITAFNTGTAIQNPTGVDGAPGVGDLVLRATQIAGAGTIDIFYEVTYRVE